ncbi:dTMP kinase [Candidatus Allofournierella excrementavium]|uniref:dTMP kinase n=1 Tax=Candidatus Allofournierella excrementavium TaxID=2838591 RepID=UPI003AF42630
MNGRLIVIEGLDGSGKATQAARLTDALNAQGKDVKQISFPDYASDSSALIKMYLGGKFGSHPDDVNAYAASTFYSVDRYASYKTNWGDFYRRGGIVVSDRYTTSNAVHQCSKLPKEQWPAFLDWLFDFEYNKIGIPVPDRVVYLEVDPAVSQGLMTTRYKGDESKKDIHEKDLAYLARSHEAADYCARTLGWVKVPCTEQGAMRPIVAIHADLLQAIKEVL